MLTRIIHFLFSHAAFSAPGGLKIEGPLIFVVPALAATIYGFIVSLRWVYKDARRRGKQGFVFIPLLFLAGWPASLLFWLWLRPPLPNTATPSA